MDQREYWNGPVGERWVRLQERFDEVFAPIRNAAIKRAAVEPGEYILDVGCGTGGTVIELARRAAPTGKVLGVDVSEPMLRRAQERLTETGVEATVELADAATRPFAGEFDTIFSAFGVMFFADPEQAFTNLRTALCEGGRLVFVCWRALAESEAMWLPYQAASSLLPPAEPSVPNAPGPFAFADGARLKRILEGAGFTDVQIEPLDLPIRIGSDLTSAVDFTLQMGPTANALGRGPDELRPVVARAVEEALAPLVTSDGVVLKTATWLVSASSAAS